MTEQGLMVMAFITKLAGPTNVELSASTPTCKCWNEINIK